MGTGGALDLYGLVGTAPAKDAEGGRLFGVGVAGGGAVEGSAVDAGESSGEVLGGEVEQGFVEADGGPVSLHAGEVEGEGDVGEGRVVGEVEADEHGEGVAEAGEGELVVGVGLERAVLGGAEGHVLGGNLGADVVARFAEVNVVPGGLGGGCGGGDGEANGEKERAAHEISGWD